MALAEFMRHAPVALEGHAFRWTGETSLEVTGAGGTIAINATEIEPLALSGSLRLPRVRIRLDFTSCEAAAAQVFLRRWDLAFQRGGG